MCLRVLKRLVAIAVSTMAGVFLFVLGTPVGAVDEFATPPPKAKVILKESAVLAVPHTPHAAIVALPRVPNVIGKPLQDARTLLSQRGLVIGSVQVLDNSAAAPGTVLRQLPAANAGLPADRKVALWVNGKTKAGTGAGGSTSDGPPADTTRVVPNVIGQTVASGRMNLRERSLVANETIVNSDRPRGVIVAQNPSAQTRVPVASTVSLSVSDGLKQQPLPPPPPVARIPNVVGLNVDQALSTLREAKLRLGARSPKISTDTPGRVIEQYPAANQPVGNTEVVNVVVAVTGPTPLPIPGSTIPQASVPPLRGLTISQAGANVKAVGLNFVGSSGYEVSSQSRDTVLRQTPPAGVVVPRSTAVRVWLSDGSRVMVPAVVGKSAEAAVATLQQNGLVQGNRTETDSSAPAGQVLGQTPLANTEVARGTAVGLVVARQLSVVPNLVGQSLEQARALLGDRKLALGAQKTQAAVAPKNQVLSQQPSAGASVVPLSSVEVTLSDASLVSVPPLEKRPASQAGDALTLVGLRLGTITEKESAGKPGTVLQQDPKAATVVARGTTVQIWVAKEPLVPVPTVVGRLKQEAEQALKSARLNAGTVSTTASSQRRDEVLSQAPAAGTAVAPRSNVALTVSDGTLVIVPNLFGRSDIEAKRLLGDAGLAPGPVTLRDSWEESSAVEAQDAAPGSERLRGSQVAFTVRQHSTWPALVHAVENNMGTSLLAVLVAGIVGGLGVKRFNTRTSATLPAPPSLPSNFAIVPHFSVAETEASVQRTPGSDGPTVSINTSWASGPSAVLAENLIESVEVKKS